MTIRLRAKCHNGHSASRVGFFSTQIWPPAVLQLFSALSIPYSAHHCPPSCLPQPIYTVPTPELRLKYGCTPAILTFFGGRTFPSTLSLSFLQFQFVTLAFHFRPRTHRKTRGRNSGRLLCRFLSLLQVMQTCRHCQSGVCDVFALLLRLSLCRP
jgi:hypothetical protein